MPLSIRWPKNFPAPASFRAGTISDRLLTLVDLTATTLALAGVPPPEKMQGRPFLGADAAAPARHVFDARDRTDNAVNRIRTVRTERFRYIRNFMPEKAFLAPHTYKDAYFPVYRVIRDWQRKGKPFTPAQAMLTLPRLPEEELYDIDADPHEVVNLAKSTRPEHQAALRELRSALDGWMNDTRDQGHVAEHPGAFEYWNNYAQQTHGKWLK